MANEINLELFVKFCNQKGLQYTSRRYRQWAKEGRVPEPEKGNIDALTALAGIAKYYQELSQSYGGMSLLDERTRLTRIQADRKELDLKKATGELINVDHAMRLWGGVLMSMRQKLLAMPVKLSALVLGVKSLAGCKEQVEKFIFEVLNEFANPKFKTITGMGGNKTNMPNIKTASKTNNKRVGRSKKNVKPRKLR